MVISKIFPHDFLAKIPSKCFFTKELYYKLISRKFFEVGVNFRNFHTVGCLIEQIYRLTINEFLPVILVVEYRKRVPHEAMNLQIHPYAINEIFHLCLEV